MAGTYHATITYQELAEKIQESTGIRTRVILPNWIGATLDKVAYESHQSGDPQLTALVVHGDDGKVGKGYKRVLEVTGEPPVDDDRDLNWHAARARLECYRRFGATLPPDGGTPALSPKHQAAIDRRNVRSKRPLR
ncbi:hypothetical protein ACFQVD_19020 [Streptosporangium amethystogenes subsp. fukuiense]|uniref:Uncharacterized protein n=1 Tax=Streptosporangium amethystogenes subsp. fukuiense TaxID=698418 RepID=A0ABW2T1C5_9ACTN